MDTRPLSPAWYRIITSLSATLAVLASISASRAQSIATPNVFSGKSVSASSEYKVASSGPDCLVDGASTQAFIFDDFQKTFALNITGFNSAIDTIRFFDNPVGSVRLADGVKIYYSAKEISTLDDPSQYESVANNGQPYPLEIAGNDYPEPAMGPNGPELGNTDGNPPVFYAEVSGLNIPAGTKSLLFVFTTSFAINGDPSAESGYLGPGFTEIQGFATKPKAP